MTKTPDHMTRALLRAARRGEISYEHVAHLLRAHLEEVCPECRRASQAEREEETPCVAYAAPLRRVRRKLRYKAELDRMLEEKPAVPGLLASLQGLSVEQRLLRIRNAPDRYATRSLGEALFAQAHACLPSDPAGARDWAKTAAVLESLYPEPYIPHRARALAFQGNAARAAGDFETAKRLLVAARDLLAEHEVVDMELEAELHSFFGSLLNDLRQFDDAHAHLDNAAQIYNMLDRDEDLARVTMKLGNLHRNNGEPEPALELYEAAAQLLASNESSPLYVAARFNYTVALDEAGHHEAARDVLACDQSLYEDHADAHTRLRVRWLEAQIATATGDGELAETAYLEVRDEFARQQHGFNAALASLDLAELYRQQGRYADLLETATQAAQIFKAQAIHRDALTALLLLRDAAAGQQVTAETIRCVASFLRRASRNSAGRFEQSPGEDSGPGAAPAL